mmetsp:Transcript_12354/g.19188  ORF Transcript_12354/g.19188 Transcript_12354/m.19188 type:complete len:96 (+) Transcript_12354:1065-1352(+)
MEQRMGSLPKNIMTSQDMDDFRSKRNLTSPEAKSEIQVNVTHGQQMSPSGDGVRSRNASSSNHRATTGKSSHTNFIQKNKTNVHGFPTRGTMTTT